MRSRWSVAFALLWSSTSWAAPPESPKSESRTESPKKEKGSLVKGEFLEPEITVVISRENLNKAYDLQLDQAFLDKIVASVEQEPF